MNLIFFRTLNNLYMDFTGCLELLDIS